ncbi:MAG TPA: hypothetical protein VE673_09695 [Pseudonocardiaceae bacterium]|nr:hypothetical protein [Pseudonocardiaceae bacterium]
MESVLPLADEDAPPGAKGIPLHVSALLITLSAAGGVLTVVIEAVRDWLARHRLRAAFL